MISLIWVEWIAVLSGLLLGSFLNVCIARLPLHESIVMPGSHCPHCNTPIRWYDNIPVLSFLILRARCRDCAHSISWQYPLVELATGAWFLLPAHQIATALNGTAPPAPALCTAVATGVFGWLLIGLMLMDWTTLTLPDAFTLPGIAVGFLFLCLETIFLPNSANDIHLQSRLSGISSMPQRGDVFLTGTEHLILGRLLAILAAAGTLLLIRSLYKQLRKQEGMGLGDAKLLAMVAAFLGWWPTVLTFFLGVLLCASYAIMLLSRGKADAASRLPFGSFLACGALIAASFGHAILRWYVSLF
ncbi:MAG: prepilin peptidase [Acidobacteriaceae bacterium]|nr:prepilin peptidase [Acidobacteriaceae bacterium]